MYHRLFINAFLYLSLLNVTRLKRQVFPKVFPIMDPCRFCFHPSVGSPSSHTSVSPGDSTCMVTSVCSFLSNHYIYSFHPDCYVMLANGARRYHSSLVPGADSRTTGTCRPASASGRQHVAGGTFPISEPCFLLNTGHMYTGKMVETVRQTG